MQKANTPDQKTPGGAEEPSVYPGTFYVSVIAEKEAEVASALASALVGFRIASPLDKGEGSSSGKYVSFRFSVVLSSREEMERMDAAVRAVPGVKMVL